MLACIPRLFCAFFVKKTAENAHCIFSFAAPNSTPIGKKYEKIDSLFYLLEKAKFHAYRCYV